jgi:hypothetical protein
MTLKAKDLILFVKRSEDMDSDRVSRMSGDGRRRGIFFIRYAGAEQVPKFTPFVLSPAPGVKPVVDAG